MIGLSTLTAMLLLLFGNMSLGDLFIPIVIFNVFLLIGYFTLLFIKHNPSNQKRTFGKTERLTFWEKWLRFISTGSGKYDGFSGHNERMEQRQRKSRFDRFN